MQLTQWRQRLTCPSAPHLFAKDLPSAVAGRVVTVLLLCLCQHGWRHGSVPSMVNRLSHKYCTVHVLECFGGEVASRCRCGRDEMEHSSNKMMTSRITTCSFQNVFFFGHAASALVHLNHAAKLFGQVENGFAFNLWGCFCCRSCLVDFVLWGSPELPR